ncbi:MAG: diadenylate cyclase CdaA [Oscillospiraceae bacterium]|nr:diadenylate cyclase CdaA [Oscillospiraceae bacterium]
MNAFLNYAVKYIQLLRISDFIDIGIVAIIVYYIITLLRDTRAMQLVKGLIVLFAVFFISRWLHFNALNYILDGAVQIGMFAVIVIFQPELRNILEKVGRFKVGKIIDFTTDTSNEDMSMTIDSVVKAAVDMSATKTGALIVIERETRLGEYISTGTVLDANVTSSLLENIFVPNTPLHDGAVIIRGNKIITAACLLPLTANNNLSRELGTRHRAAIGLSEATDAIIVVVSEETGKISIARNGSLTRNLSQESLTKALRKTLLQNAETTETIDKIKFWRSSK